MKHESEAMAERHASLIPLLAELLRAASLPAATSIQPLTGRGFENEVYGIQLADGRQVVLRRWREPREPELIRARFLESHGIPAPRLLTGTRHASLYEYAHGTLLGDLIETGRCTEETCRMVGRAFRRLHAIRFPPELAGDILPHQIILRPIDSVAHMHEGIEEAVPGLRQRAPDAVAYLPALHAIVDRAAAALRTPPTTLLHGDVFMWNIIVSDDGATLIDWDYPRVGAPAREVALLDKHAALFNGHGLGATFFEGYGQPPLEPNTSLHRIVETMAWAASSDWASFEQQPLAEELRVRTRAWLTTLLAYVAQMPTHIERLRTLT